MSGSQENDGPAAVGRAGMEQESFWRGEFGDAYVDRNAAETLLAGNLAHWAATLRRAPGVTSALELGCNVGANLQALRLLRPGIKLSAVEINEKAARAAREAFPHAEISLGSLLDYEPAGTFDLVFTCGVLIHQAPDVLPHIYDLMHRASARYLMVCEYYNPSPVEISYRGHTGKLFKRDFAGDLLDRFDDLRLVDYEFVYRRDPVYPRDDTTWFLLEKVAR
ncbi:pseudaminic acid biosynthesis-associated methylase [Alienimonas californiensis]|uniref:Methyltransferase domain protein n=1 Tax=Alienimonas californiensis TaxID=2527989 RepID=A0A517PD43_9PLAN|nr:pseudaminic acid biosynthesis-associated methylase [Alienimonas californiensis]QDT17292.1 Methyltransferase domain protein [Alienimonas californiensis]